MLPRKLRGLATLPKKKVNALKSEMGQERIAAIKETGRMKRILHREQIIAQRAQKSALAAAKKNKLVEASMVKAVAAAKAQGAQKIAQGKKALAVQRQKVNAAREKIKRVQAQEQGARQAQLELNDKVTQAENKSAKAKRAARQQVADADAKAQRKLKEIKLEEKVLVKKKTKEQHNQQKLAQAKLKRQKAKAKTLLNKIDSLKMKAAMKTNEPNRVPNSRKLDRLLKDEEAEVVVAQSKAKQSRQAAKKEHKSALSLMAKVDDLKRTNQKMLAHLKHAKMQAKTARSRMRHAEQEEAKKIQQLAVAKKAQAAAEADSLAAKAHAKADVAKAKNAARAATQQALAVASKEHLPTKKVKEVAQPAVKTKPKPQADAKALTAMQKHFAFINGKKDSNSARANKAGKKKADVRQHGPKWAK